MGWLAGAVSYGPWLVFYAVAVGTFTFLFTDIEGSTALLGRVGQDIYARVLADHHSIIRSGLAAHGGREVDTQGDAFFAVFSSPAACVAAVIEMQQALAAHKWPGGEQVRVRMGVHTGEASATATGLVGLDVHRAARLAAAGHGGQVLVSQASAALVGEVLPLGAVLADLGVHRLKDLEHPVRIFQLRAAGLPGEFPPLRTVPGGAAAATRSLPRDLASFTGRQRELEDLVEAAAGASWVVGIHAIGGMAGVGKTALAVHAAHRLGPPAAPSPGLAGAGRAAELAASVDRLELMATEHLSVEAAFDLSYADLAGDQQRLFRRLGLHPGTDVDAFAAAALDGTGLTAARRGLEALYDQYLLAEPAQGRYRMHDLIREHARALAGRLDPDHDRDDAVIRLLNYYHHTAARADAFFARQARPALAPPDGAIPAAIPAMADAEQAFAWARAERASLLACLDHVTRTDQYARIISLTAGLAGLLRRDGPWTDAITRQTLAVQAARHLGDRLGQANALSHLANVRGLAGDYPGALRELTEALGLHHEIGDRLGEACDLHDRGDLRGTTGDYPGAARDLEEALSIYREIGSQVGQANTLANLGYMRGLTGDYPGAVQALEQALGIHREIGDRFGQAGDLTDLGEMRLATGDYSAATQALEQALDIQREIGTRLGQANTLDSLGRVRSATGDYTGAAEVLEEALAIARDIGNRLAQANALDSLGHARSATGDYPGAAQALEQALALNRETGNPLGQANALDNLGKVRLATGDYPGAAQALEQALDIHRELGDRTGQGTALGYLGDVRRVTGDYLAAAQALEQALDIFRDIGNRNGEAEALNGRGTLHRVCGELAQAEECHRRALETARAIATSQHEAHALADLGRCAMAAGRATQAEALLRQALEIFQRIGAAEAAAVSAELDALIDPRPAD